MVSSTIGNINRYSMGEMPRTYRLAFGTMAFELATLELALGRALVDDPITFAPLSSAAVGSIVVPAWAFTGAFGFDL